jgi:hypothetical protein
MDEIRISPAMSRNHARPPHREHAEASVPFNQGSKTSVIGPLSSTDVGATMGVEGAVDTGVFAPYVVGVFWRSEIELRLSRCDQQRGFQSRLKPHGVNIIGGTTEIPGESVVYLYYPLPVDWPNGHPIAAKTFRSPE